MVLVVIIDFVIAHTTHRVMKVTLTAAVAKKRPLHRSRVGGAPVSAVAVGRPKRL